MPLSPPADPTPLPPPSSHSLSGQGAWLDGWVERSIMHGENLVSLTHFATRSFPPLGFPLIVFPHAHTQASCLHQSQREGEERLGGRQVSLHRFRQTDRRKEFVFISGIRSSGWRSSCTERERKARKGATSCIDSLDYMH
mmetsp:Transcript_10610/g.20581  ORF Transcript_10610/g.20581 Transcript_10610/m.20581 type:complete len:140 (-) Transcript_10610:329-748(-)